MPSFETLILSSPSGFTQACQLANTLITENEAYFVDLVHNAWKSMNGINDIKPRRTEALDSIYSAFSFLGRSMMEASPTMSVKGAASILDSTTVLSRSTIELFLLTWVDSEKAVAAAAESGKGSQGFDLDKIRQGGTMFDLKWKICSIVNASVNTGVFKGSDKVFPYVEIAFKIRHGDGIVTAHDFSMSYDGFQDFLGQVKDACTAMDMA